MIPSTSKALALACLLAPGLNAVTLATYDFDGVGFNAAGPYAVGSYDETGLSSAGDITYITSTGSAQGITPQGDIDRGVPSPSIKDNFANNGFSSTTLDNAIDNDDYLSFTLTPTSGNTLSFGSGDTISFDAQMFYAGSAPDPVNSNLFFALLTSVDGFSSANQVGSTETFSFNGVGGAESGFNSLSISLASLGTIGTDVPIEFRLYAYRTFDASTGTVTNISSRYMNIDNIVTTGSSIIPEPSSSTVALGSFILLFVLAGVRKVRRQEQA